MKITIEKLLPTGIVHSKKYYLVVIGLDSRYLYVNNAFREAFSFLETDFIGVHTDLTLHPDDIVKCSEAALACITQEAVISVQLRKPYNKMGNYNWSNWEFSVLKENDEVLGFMCIGNDITELERNKLLLQQNENILRAIYSSSIDAMVFVNTDREVVYFNQAAENLGILKYKRKIKLGDDFINFFDEDLKKILILQFEQNKKGEVVRKDFYDGKNWYKLTQYPVYDANNVFVGVAFDYIDITLRKDAEMKIIKQNERLRNIAWRESHELRKHLANILGIVNILKSDGANNMKADFLQYLTDETNKLDGVVHDIVSDAALIDT